MKKLYFIRHGLSEDNIRGVFNGRGDSPLSKKGEKQTKLVAAKAKSLNLDIIVSSPYKRAYKTAKIIAKNIGYPENQIITNGLFIERDLGVLEGTKYIPHHVGDHIEEIETVKQIQSRAIKALRFLDSLSGENILIVSHASFGRALRSQLYKDYDFHHPKPFGNAEIVHFAKDKITYL
ncbi:MAG TPA: histidine phosphatase family protein [Candidatus Saccharimonadia bacterium]|nr:histidine phosphatase family protein [Candidatus Saccharimonadia bacterium]